MMRLLRKTRVNKRSEGSPIMRATVRAVKLGTTYLRTKPLLEHLVVGGLVMRHRVHRVPQLRKLKVHAAASAALISQWPLCEGNEMLQA
jgi:hypothetical protein